MICGRVGLILSDMVTAHPILIERMTRLMEERELNGAQLRDMAGVNQTGIYDILSGKTRSPKLETVEKIAKALKTSVAYLIGETDERHVDDFIADWPKMPAEQREALRRVAAAFQANPQPQTEDAAESF